MNVRALVAVSALAWAGCVGEAPKELDALLHYFWDNYDAPHAMIEPAVDNLHAAIGGETIRDHKGASLTSLEQHEVDMVHIAWGPKAKNASGIYMAKSFACDWSELEKLTYWQDQKSLHDSAYESYMRTYTSDFDAYLGRKTDALTWDSHYKTKIAASTFTNDSKNGMRVWQGGRWPIMLVRSWLTDKSDASSGSDFSQDYQLEVYYRRDDGRIVHAYAIWRDMNVGGITDDQDFFQSTMIDQMSKWDSDNEDLCAAGKP